MKKATTLISLWILLAFTNNSFAQSTATVGGAGADYATLKLAFDDINNGTLTGKVTLQITGSCVVTASAYIKASGVGSASYSTITIYPTVACSITGSINDNLIYLNGADSVTIDGRINQTGSVSSLEISNTHTGTKAATITFQNSATYNVVKYVLLKGASAAISSQQDDIGIVSFLSTASGTQGNAFNTITYCEITGDTAAPPRIGIFSDGTGGFPLNTNNIISYNKVHGFFGKFYENEGIYLKNQNKNWTISNNSIYQAIYTGGSTPGTMYFIRIDYDGFTTNIGDDFTISNNILGGTDANANGTYISSGTLYLIYINVSFALNAIGSNITGNVIRGIIDPHLTAIRTNGKVNITLNDCGGSLYSNRIVASVVFLTSRDSRAIITSNSFKNIKARTLVEGGIVKNNYFTNDSANTIVNADSVAYNNFYRVFYSSSVAEATRIYYNTISNSQHCKGGSISTRMILATGYCSNNTIRNCNTFPEGTLYLLYGTVVLNNFVSCDSFTTGKVIGIDLSRVAKNNIINIQFNTPSSPASPHQVSGIQVHESSYDTIYNNTISIGGYFGYGGNSHCINLNYENGVFNTKQTIRNNIFSINSLSTTDSAVCIRTLSSSDGVTATFDYNNYFKKGLNVFIGTTSRSTVATCPTLLTWQDQTFQEDNGISKDPLFYDITAAIPYGFIPGVTMKGVSLTEVPKDILNNPRGNPPTMGAIEFGTCYPTILSSNAAACQSFSFRGKTYTSSGSYPLTLKKQGGCDTLYTLNLTIDKVSATPTISANGATTFCASDSLALSADATGTWSNGSTGSYIFVNQPGVYYLARNNSCITDTSNKITVVVKPIPSPVITENSNTLSCQTFDTYQWNAGSAPITGATNQSYKPSVSGYYSVTTSNANGCSASSPLFPYFITGIEQPANTTGILIFPNPGSQLITLTTKQALQDGAIKIVSIEGKIIYQACNVNGTNHTIDMSTFANGIYFIEVKNNGITGREKIVKN